MENMTSVAQGFTKSLAMTVLSEIGDKTFFAAAKILPGLYGHVEFAETCDWPQSKSLLTRLDLAINSVSTSDLKPLETESEFKSLRLYKVPVISGTSQVSTSGEYFSRVGIEKPASPSLSYTSNTGIDNAGTTRVSTRFRTGMGLIPLVILLLELSLSARLQLIMWVSAVDIIMINEGLFIGAAGLLGLEGGSLSFPSQIITTSFSYCLVDRGSESASTLEFNSTLPPNTVTAPLIRNHQLDTFYYVGLTGLGELLQTDVYSSLSDAFVRERRTCHQLTGYRCLTRVIICLLEGIVEVPTVSFHFPDGKYVTVTGEKLHGSARLGRNVLFRFCSNGVKFV
ncbi:hypothetical protein NC651_020468 [Populus alba x Populus x berolinensis]|nr:hypothetical protein NC651_020468 [Populus alba x Populus x berolinensis]